MSPCQEALLPSTYCYPSRTIARSIDEVPFVDGLPESPRNSSPHTAGDSLLQLSTLPPEVSGTGIDHLYSDDTCELVTYGSLWQSPSLFRVEKLIGSAPRYTSTTTQSKFSQIVQSPIFIHILGYLNHKRLLKTRRVSKAWKSAVECVRPLKFPTVYYLPVELIQQILLLSSASSFENARKTCRAWYYSSLETFLLQHHLNSMGFSRSDPLVCVSKNPVYLSRRLSRECSLGSDGSGKCRIRKAAVLDMSEMATTEIVNFTVSKCGSHVLLSEGCIVYVYRIEPGSDTLMEFVASIVCPRRVLAVSMDTSNMRYSVAILLVWKFACILLSR
ncbi:hypothetical protein EDC01DRAFT_77171 [Geopyxis carbonaria]|nr:hypothetical protein EDC01DRAFT_77171 [Geopyxis carbonaria]